MLLEESNYNIYKKHDEGNFFSRVNDMKVKILRKNMSSELLTWCLLLFTVGYSNEIIFAALWKAVHDVILSTASNWFCHLQSVLRNEKSYISKGPFKLNNISLENKWLQQHGTTAHFENETIQLLENLMVKLIQEKVMIVGHQDSVIWDFGLFSWRLHAKIR